MNFGYKTKISYFDSEGNYFGQDEDNNHYRCKHDPVDTGFLKSWCKKCNVDMKFNRESFKYEVSSESSSKGT